MNSERITKLTGLGLETVLALTMLVVGALIGTQDLCQEVFPALKKTDARAGPLAGLSVDFIPIIADRFMQALAATQRERLGLWRTV